MRGLVTAILLSLSISLSATTYYVSNAGNDSNDGKSEATAWRTIAKVNTTWESGIFAPGDKIMFRRGDSFFGTIKVKESGIENNHITLSAYGSGARPIITGMAEIQNWHEYKTGIYFFPIKSESASSNLVTINGVNTPMGRWPNSEWMTYESNANLNSITDNQLSNTPNWKGAELVFRKSWWTLERVKITDHNNTTLSFNSYSTWGLTNGYGYFIQNDIKTLDRFGEWYYDSDTLFVYFGSNKPTDYVVKMSTLDYLVSSGENNSSYFNYITLDNLCFDGSTSETVHLAIRTHHWKVENCVFNHSGKNAIDGNQLVHHITIKDNIIKNSNNNAIRSIYKGYNNVIKNNTIDSTGVLIGMMSGDDDGGDAIVLKDDGTSNGSTDTIMYNTITNTGHCGLRVQYKGYYVADNYISRHGVIKNDVGGIYTWNANTITLQNNIILNGYGNSGGCGSTSEFGLPDPYTVGCYGIYLDEKTYNVIIDNNTTAFNRDGGIFIQMDSIVYVTNNTSFDNGYFQIALVQRLVTNDFPVRKITMNNNKFIAKQPGKSTFPFRQLCMLAMTYENNDINQFGTFDNNIYARPIDQDDVFRAFAGNPFSPWNGTGYTIETWKSFSGQDKNSTGSMAKVSDTTEIHFIYNKTNKSKDFKLSTTFMDVAGATYSVKVTLEPFTSKVLLGKGTIEESTEPVTIANPEFVNAVVENATPSRIDMTYNLSLASIVPAASAFTVMVNSSPRSVSSVAVSGTKVQLTLASPAAYGDVITVAYAKPATNPLQTTEGGQAASLSASKVTNNIGAVAPSFVSAVIENATPARLTMTYNQTLASIVPAATAFTVMVNSSVRSVTAVAVSGTQVALTLASPVVYGDVVTVAYTAPSINPLQASTGAQAATISARSVTNNVAPVTPVFVSAVVENATPAQLDMTYSLSLANIVPDITAFTVMVNTTAVSVTAVSVSNTMVSLTLAAPVKYGDVVKVSYTRPFANPLQTNDGAAAATISLQNVTNNCAATTSKSSTTADISVYPVPAVDYITIDIRDDFTETLTLKIYDMAGRTAMTVLLEPTEKTVTIPIKLKSGSYLIQVIKSGVTIYTQKIMVKSK